MSPEALVNQYNINYFGVSSSAISKYLIPTTAPSTSGLGNLTGNADKPDINLIPMI